MGAPFSGLFIHKRCVNCAESMTSDFYGKKLNIAVSADDK
jgi:hypothetical protein